MIVRNEAGRYLGRSLGTAQRITRASGGKIIITDDASTDITALICGKYTDNVQILPEPMYWSHEGRARQLHLDYVTLLVQEGDWVLSLDADESISDPEALVAFAQTVPSTHDAIGLPLYEFWEPSRYRVDGQWFGTMSSRLWRWHDAAEMADREMASGSEPTYVQRAIGERRWSPQKDIHLLHWGYLDPEDRNRKYQAYTQRVGGHGHNNQHVQSILGAPVLRDYP